VTAQAPVDYDVLLIGTGPPMLLRGLAMAEAGRRVVFVDEADCIGGSWKVRTVFGLGPVEVGVHLIENRPHLTRTFESLFGDGGLGRGAQDFGLVRGRRIPMPLARVLLYGLVAGKSALRARTEKALHSLRNLALAARFLRVPFVYPNGGTAALLLTLAGRLDAAGARILLGRRVRGVRVLADGVEADADGGTIAGRHLVMSSRAHAPIAGAEALWSTCETMRTYSYVLLMSGSPALFGGYVEVIGDRLIKRARNVGGFVEPRLPDDRTLLVVQLRRPPDGIDDLPQAIRARLADLGLVAPEAEVVAAAADHVDLRTLPGASLDRIAAAHGRRVTVLRTVDLGDQHHPLGSAAAG
jgi:hypothetical protein